MPSQTPNFGLTIEDFNKRGWHTAMNNNLRLLDAILATAISIGNFQGDYQNSTVYSAGDKVVDTDTGVIYVALIDGTSPATGTFEDYRTSHPTYWTAYALDAESRGAWAADTDYVINDFVVSDYKYAVCIEAHTSGITFDSDSSKWEVLVDLTDTIEMAEQSAADAEASAAAAAASAGTVIGWLSSVVEASANTSLVYSTQNGFLVLVDATGGNKTIELPAASSSPGCRFAIKKADASANTVTVIGLSSDNVEGGVSAILTNQHDCITLMRRHASDWSIVDRYYSVLPVARGGTGQTSGSAATLIGLGMSTYAASTIAAATDGAGLAAALGYPAYGNSLVSATDANNARTILGLSSPAVTPMSDVRAGYYKAYHNNNAPPSTTSWTKANEIPSNVLYVDIMLQGGGGGGSPGDTSIPSRGNGGSGGEFIWMKRIPTASLADTETIIVGGRAAPNTDGKYTSFGTLGTAAGGTAGAAATSGAQAGAAGGQNGVVSWGTYSGWKGGDASYKFSNTDGIQSGGDAYSGFGGGKAFPGQNGVGYGGGGGGGNYAGSITAGTGLGGLVIIRGVL